MNEKPFDHQGRYLSFTASRCDFAEGVEVEVTGAPSRVDIINDVAAMIGFHATNIHPHLNGFQGYDCCGFKFVHPKSSPGDVTVVLVPGSCQ